MADKYVEVDLLKMAIEAEPFFTESTKAAFRNIINKVPGADIEPVKRGEWRMYIVFGQRAWSCSHCKTSGSPHWKRCPVCEAKMEVANG